MVFRAETYRLKNFVSHPPDKSRRNGRLPQERKYRKTMT
jgi:hypothetical protein